MQQCDKYLFEPRKNWGHHQRLDCGIRTGEESSAPHFVLSRLVGASFVTNNEVIEVDRGFIEYVIHTGGVWPQQHT